MDDRRADIAGKVRAAIHECDGSGSIRGIRADHADVSAHCRDRDASRRARVSGRAPRLGIGFGRDMRRRQGRVSALSSIAE